MTKRHAVALRAFTHADDTFAKSKPILNMDAGQFADWESAGLVREATDAEVARAKDEPSKVEVKPAAKPRPPRKAKAAAKAATPAPEPISDTAPASVDA